MNKKGQSILSEYVMIFFVVIAALVAMTTFVQRGLEARVNDARNFMINAVVNSGACDTNCLQATGATVNQIPQEYEPYYAQTLSDVQHNEQENTGITNASTPGPGDIYIKSLNEETQTISISNQLQPECANGGC